MFPWSNNQSKYIAKEWLPKDKITNKSVDVALTHNPVSPSPPDGLNQEDIYLWFKDKHNEVIDKKNADFSLVYNATYKKHLTLATRVRLFDEFGFLSDKNRKEQDRQNSLHKIRLDEQLHKQERKQKEKAAREQRHQEWREDFELTQRMLSIMRKNGSIPATNNRAGRFDDLPVDRDSESVIIRVIQLAVKYSDTQQIDLNIDLKQFSNVTKIKGVDIGWLGAKRLSKYLLHGSCPHLNELNLAWNSIQSFGITMLLQNFESRCLHLKRVDVKGNNISANGVRALRQCIQKGGLELLEHLDLSMNPIRSDGAIIMTHIIFDGNLKRLIRLNLSKCLIGDSGIKALFSACNACKSPALMPNIDFVSVKSNTASQQLLENCQPWPKTLQL